MRWLFFLLLFFNQISFAAGESITPACVRTREAKARFTKPVASHKAKMKKQKRMSSSKDEPVLKLPKFTPVSWTGKKERGWFEVQSFDKKNYWVRRSDLSFTTTCLQVKVSKSQLRTGPGSDFEKIQLAEKGAVFKDLGGEDGWTQVESPSGQRSWINLDHTWKPHSKLRMSFINDP